jgi:hypothetical protein
MAVIFAIADIIHESILNTGDAISTIIGRSSPASQVDGGASPETQTAGNRKVVEREQSRITSDSMMETTSQRIPKGELVRNQEKVGLDRL